MDGHRHLSRRARERIGILYPSRRGCRSCWRQACIRHDDPAYPVPRVCPRCGREVDTAVIDRDRWFCDLRGE